MDEHTPIDVPIRLEEWDRHDCINEVDTIVVDARPILDAADYDHLPAPDDWDADFIAEEAQRLGLLKPWDGPFTVELPECGEYPAYLEWRGTHRVVEGARERFRALARDEILSRIERTQAELDRLVAEIQGGITGTHGLDVTATISDPDKDPGEWVERKTVRQQRRIEGDK